MNSMGHIQLFLVVLTFVMSKGLLAQNLILNPSFEDINYCTEYHEDCSPAAWRNTGLKLARYKKKNNYDVFGQRSMSLLLFDQARSFDRRFLQTRLLAPLEKGKLYYFTIFVKPDIKCVESIQLHFSNELYFFEKIEEVGKLSPDLTLDLPANLKVGEWIKLKGEYRAKGNENCLLFGNLLSDEETKVTIVELKTVKKNKKRYNPQSRIYLELDGLSLISDEEVVIEDLESMKNSIYADHLRHSLRSDWREIEIAYDTKLVESKEKIFASVNEIETTVDTSFAVDKEFVLSGVLFAFGEAQLTAAAFAELDRLYLFLKNNPEIKIDIIGHTDNIGSPQRNQQLSAARAFSVFSYLDDRGIVQKRMQFSGQGAAQPISSNASEEGRAANRRVRIQFLK